MATPATPPPPPPSLHHLKQIHANALRTNSRTLFNTLSLHLYSHNPLLSTTHTFLPLLKTCAFLRLLPEGHQLHAQVLKLGFAVNPHVNNSLIHFYFSCKLAPKALRVFNTMPVKSAVSFNTVIDGLVRNGVYENAIGLFVQMQSAFPPDGYTIQSAAKACAETANLGLGMWVHCYWIRRCGGGISEDVLVGNSLVDMYFKCGCAQMAFQVFQGMHFRNINSWNALILGLSRHGSVKEVIWAFSCMCVDEGWRPNSITFVGVLSACNHGGLVEEGRKYFELMVEEFQIEPRIEHYGCMVDLFARAGQVEEALNVVLKMPCKPDAVIWRSLLDALWRRNVVPDVGVSELVAKRILESKEGITSGVYVLLSKIYASACRWNDVATIRGLMDEKGIKKEAGRSSIEIDGVVVEFIARDRTNPRAEEIYVMLQLLEEQFTAFQ